MIKLLGESTYQCGDFDITVSGLNCDQLSAILPICQAKDRQLKARIMEIAADHELTEAVNKQNAGEQLSAAEVARLVSFGIDKNDNFEFKDLFNLWQNYESCVMSVKQNDQDVTEEFKDLLKNSPRYLQQMGAIIYQEYKAATELPDLKKK